MPGFINAVTEGLSARAQSAGPNMALATADGIPIDYVTTTPAMKAYGIFQVCMMRGWALPGAKCSKSPLPGQLGMRGVVGLSHS